MVLGFVIAHVNTIEFENVYCRMLTFYEADKFKMGKIDQIVCAEIPDKDRHPRLHDIATRYMYHGPCGSANPTARCKENAKREFPRAYIETTQSLCRSTFVNIRKHLRTIDINVLRKL